MSARREVKQMLDRLCRTPGWSWTTRKGGHIKITGPGCVYFTGSTPSDCRAIRRLRSDLRRRGAPV